MTDVSRPGPVERPDNYAWNGLDLFDRLGAGEALVDRDRRRYTFAELAARIRATAALLWEHGIRPGMTIGVLATNPPETYFVQLGAHLLGCRTVFLSHSTPHVFLRTVLDFVDADAFIYEVAHVGEIGAELAAAEGSGRPRTVLCIGAGGLGPDLVDAPEISELPFTRSAVSTDPVTLFQTSGTTGTPKLVQHGQRFFASIIRVSAFYRPDDLPMRHLLVSASWHSGAQSAALMTWFCGGTLVMNFGLDVPVLLTTLATERITSINLSPPYLYLLLDDDRLATTDVSTMRSLTVSASPASPARLREARRWFGPALNVVYGMSEDPFITVLSPADDDPDHPERISSAGRPWGDAVVEIRDADGVPQPTGVVGEIFVRSELVTEGYFGLPDVTAETLVDGWMRTGDLGQLDADGYLTIVDRVKDMIVTDVSSTNVYCRPLEDALAAHPQVRQAAVVGVPDPFLGEAVHAFVIRTPGATVTADELRQVVIDTLNPQWSPREVEFVTELPLTGIGKVDKKALRARYMARTDAGTIR